MDVLITGLSQEDVDLLRGFVKENASWLARFYPNPLCRVLIHNETNEVEVIVADSQEVLSDGFIEERWQQFEWEDRDVSDEPLADFVAVNDRHWAWFRLADYEVCELQGGE